MKRCLSMLVTGLMGVAFVWADGRPSKLSVGSLLAAPEVPGTIAITFIPQDVPIWQPGSGQASLDLGEVSYWSGARQFGVSTSWEGRALVVSASFGLRVDQAGSKSGSAHLSAFVFSGDTQHPVLIDGMRLWQSLSVLNPRLPFGTVSSHTISIVVPAAAHPGPVGSSVGLLVTAN